MNVYTNPVVEIKRFETQEPTMLNLESIVVPDPDEFEGGGLH